MDYGFAPGKTPVERHIREMFPLRSGTKGINRTRWRRTVQEFINHLNTNPSITKPVGDFLLGAHADRSGYLDIGLSPRQFGISFEGLVKSLANPTLSVKIPDTLIGFHPGDPVTHSFHIKGCSIGKARPFLVKLKEALGGNVEVTGPKHITGYAWEKSYGVWEYMCYEYSIYTPKALAPAVMIAAFMALAGKFKRIDGSDVPMSDLLELLTNKKLISTDGFPSGQIPLSDPVRKLTTIPVTHGLSIDSGTVNYYANPVEGQPLPKTPGQVPPAQAAAAYNDCSQLLEQMLLTYPEFQDTHPFPYHKRLGYASIADYIANHNWTFSHKKQRLFCVGEQFEYTVIMPIRDLSTGKFLVNFYPKLGSGSEATVGLPIGDARFFEKV